MLKNQTTITQIAMVVVALLVGTSFGTWVTHVNPPAAPVVSAPLPTPAPKPTVAKIVSETKAEEPSTTSARFTKSLEEILKDRNPANRTRELEEFAKNISVSQIAGALKQLARMPENSTRELAIRLLASKWIESDPEGALKFAIDNHDFDYLASDVMQQMAAQDFQGALARAQTITDSNARYQAFRGILSFMADSDPVGALQLAGTLGNFPNQEPLSNMIYRQWSAIDPQAAAMRAAQDQQGDGWRSPVNQVLRTWASQDPMSAINWSTTQADPSMQARDIGQIVRQWSRDDMNAAASWVNGLAPGSVRDAAAAGMAFSLGWNDPNAALGWAQSISDPTQRDNALQRLSREIMYRDPTNGAAILAAAGVPENLLPPPPNNPGQGGGGGRRGRP